MGRVARLPMFLKNYHRDVKFPSFDLQVRFCDRPQICWVDLPFREALLTSLAMSISWLFHYWRMPAARQASPIVGLSHARLARLAATLGNNEHALAHAKTAIAVRQCWGWRQM